MRCPGVADEAHAPLGEIGIGAERVEHLAVGAAIERVDREVAPARVGRPVVGEGNRRMTAVRLHVLAQRRDLVGGMIGDNRHRAMGNAGWHGAEARRSAAAITSSGRAGVAMSMSVTGRPSSALRTAPPTARAANPRAASAANTALVSGRVSQLGIVEAGRGRRGHDCRALLQGAGLDAPVLHARRRVDAPGFPPGVVVP